MNLIDFQRNFKDLVRNLIDFFTNSKGFGHEFIWFLKDLVRNLVDFDMDSKGYDAEFNGFLKEFEKQSEHSKAKPHQIIEKTCAHMAY